MKVTVTWGQDTPAYATEVIEVPDDANDGQIIEAVMARADAVGNLVFDPSYDWTGLRAVEISAPDGRVIDNDVAIEPSGEDLGLVVRNVMSGAVSLEAMLHEAERQNIVPAQEVIGALKLAGDAMAARKALPEIPSFTPYQLVIDAFACNQDGDSPSYAAIEVKPEFLAKIARVSAAASAAGIRVAHVDADNGIWSDPDNSLRMRDSELVVYPKHGAGNTSFWFRGHPKNADYDCETRAIDLNDLITSVSTDGELPSGFERDRGVLFYDGGAGTAIDLRDLYFEGSDAEH